MSQGAYADVFAAANPLVSGATCSSNLVAGTSYCVAPVRAFNLFIWDQGCYPRLGGLVLDDASMTSPSITVLKCAEFCVFEKWNTVFGIQNGDTCLYDTSLNYGSVPATDPSSACNVPCAGNATALSCGGPSAVSVFSTQPEAGIKLAPPTDTTSPDNTPAEPSYLGCYTELANARALAQSSYTSPTEMTVSTCAAFCLTTQNQTLFGL